MANSYTQIHIQVVFAPKYRAALLSPSWNERLHQYITGIIRARGHQLLAINAMPDHIHIFFGMRPHQSLSSLVQEIKANSSRWINEQNLTRKLFRWQDGYGAFSYKRKMCLLSKTISTRNNSTTSPNPSPPNIDACYQNLKSTTMKSSCSAIRIDTLICDHHLLSLSYPI